jgi:hypothetical protein
MPGNLELDLNFLLRTPLWPVTLCDSRPVGSFQALQVPLVDLHELAGGKLAALLSRQASRDAFDARELLSRKDLDLKKLRLAFTVYGAASRRDLRTVSAESVDVDFSELWSQLVSVLRTPQFATAKEAKAWGIQLVNDCRALLSQVLPLSKDEDRFIGRLCDIGEISPELITDDVTMQATISNHPALRWKALNVRKHLGTVTDADDV